MWDVTDTIAAIASAPGGAARGVVRVSGDRARAVLEHCFRAQAKCEAWPHSAPACREGLVEAGGALGWVPCQALVWPTARSYTRQLVVEFHTLGSSPILEGVLRAVCAQGARVAEPGEFTLRAFLAGRIDLVQAEAVLGVIDAAGRRELDAALAQLSGGLSGPLARLRSELLDLLAHLEAGLDFVEEDIEFITVGELVLQLQRLESQIRQLEAQMSFRGDAQDLFRVVLLGAPNVGKSSLMNALCGDHAALVANVPGTTRDYVSRRVNFHGVNCELVDTAGLHDEGAVGQESPASAKIGELAQGLSLGRALAAHLQVWCFDSSRNLTSWEQAQLARAAPGPRLLVLTQADRPRRAQLGAEALVTSSVLGQGIEALKLAISRVAGATRECEGGLVAATAVRCRESVRRAGECLGRAQALAQDAAGSELVAAEIRAALEELGLVLGAIYTDDLLDRIFSRFCIGK